MDANLLIALIAPRRCLLQPAVATTGPIPKAKFLAAVGAGKVYKLLGKEDLGTDVWPASQSAHLSRPQLLHA